MRHERFRPETGATKTDRPGLVTVFCDASYCPETKAAGFGAWYRAAGMEKGSFFGGQVPVACSSSNDGEFWGLALALTEVRKRLGGAKPEAIILQCDNLAALAWVGRFHPMARAVGERHETHAIPDAPASYPDTMAAAVNTIRTVFGDIPIWLKHVKGHDGRSKTARSWVNRQCDREAREHMTARRALIRRKLRGA